MRKAHPVAVYGTYDLILPEHARVYAYTRTLGREKLLVICNLFAEEAEIELPQGVNYASSELLLSNVEVDRKKTISELTLKPYEARVYLLSE